MLELFNIDGIKIDQDLLEFVNDNLPQLLLLSIKLLDHTNRFDEAIHFASLHTLTIGLELNSWQSICPLTTNELDTLHL